MRLLGGIVAMLVVLTGCTGGDSEDDKPDKPAALTREDTAVKPAWTLELDPIGQPVVAGDTGTGPVAVVIARETGKRLKIVGADARTGQQLWSHPVSPNNVVPGIALTPTVTTNAAGKDRVVLYLAKDKPSGRDDADLFTPIVSVDPASGTIERRSPKIWASTTVSSCEDDTDVCVKGALEGEQKSHNRRFDVDTGKLTRVDEGAPPNARLIGADGLFSTSDRPGEKLGVRRGGKTLWSAPVDSLFGPGRSSDGGWSFHHEKRPDRYTGILGQVIDSAELTKDDPRITYDLAKQVMISFDGHSGKILWSKKGADFCFEPTDLDDEAALEVVEHPVRCAVSGTFTTHKVRPVYKNPRLTVEGYDPETGGTTWSHPVPPAQALAYVNDAPRPLIRTQGTRVLPLAKGPVLVDVATGKTSSARGQTFMCQTETVDVDYVVPWEYGDRRERTRHGTGLALPCTADGRPAPKGLTTAAVREGAVKAGGSWYVLASKAGLVGYRAK